MTNLDHLMLAHLVFASVADQQLVLLDVTRDRYFALSRDDTALLLAHVPVRNHHNSRYAQVIGNLTKGQLLRPARPDQTRATILQSTRSGFRWRAGLAALLRLIPLASTQIWSAQLRARDALVHSALTTLIRNCRAPGAIADSAPVQHYSSPIVAAYNRLAWATRSDTQCLLHCLALGELVAGTGARPTIVFGVRGNPFAAHCWLEVADCILEPPGDVGALATFVPIMKAELVRAG